MSGNPPAPVLLATILSITGGGSDSLYVLFDTAISGSPADWAGLTFGGTTVFEVTYVGPTGIQVSTTDVVSTGSAWSCSAAPPGLTFAGGKTLNVPSAGTVSP